MTAIHENNRPAMLAISLALAWAMTSLTGCGVGPYRDYDAFITTPKPLVSTDSYRLSPPDGILIVSRRVPEINNHRETIRPDGKITLPLLGSVFVAGKTVEEVSAELREMAGRYYEDADVTVRVSDFNSKRIFVFGEVGRPGIYPYTGANTVLQTLSMAQPTRLADATRIHILRPTGDGKVAKRMSIDLDKMVKEGDVALNAMLQEGDIIYVQPTFLAATGLALQQVLLPLQPLSATVQSPVDIHGSFSAKPYDRGGDVQ